MIVLQRRKKQADEEVCLDAAMYLELTCSMLKAGLSVTTCLVRLGELQGGRFQAVMDVVVARINAGGTWEQAWSINDLPECLIPLKDTLGFMVKTGAPTADLLEVMAERQRRNSYRIVEKSAAKLGVKLVVPLGLCSLPAFICLGVIPVLIALVPSVMS